MTCLTMGLILLALQCWIHCIQTLFERSTIRLQGVHTLGSQQLIIGIYIFSLACVIIQVQTREIYKTLLLTALTK